MNKFKNSDIDLWRYWQDAKFLVATGWWTNMATFETILLQMVPVTNLLKYSNGVISSSSCYETRYFSPVWGQDRIIAWSMTLTSNTQCTKGSILLWSVIRWSLVGIKVTQLSIGPLQDLVTWPLNLRPGTLWVPKIKRAGKISR